MKFFVIAIAFGLSVCASEMDRIEAIVLDIEKLRKEYTVCKNELDIYTSKGGSTKLIENGVSSSELKELEKKVEKYEKLLNQERLQNSILEAKLDVLNEENDKNKNLLKNNDKSNNNKNNLLISKENNYNTLIEKYKQKIKEKEKTIISLKNQINKDMSTKATKDVVCKTDENVFPKLTMKKKNSFVKQKSSDVAESVKFNDEIEEVFEASSFRLNKDSDIYDSVNGNILYRWESKTSFTSTVMTKNWIKITGYFVNREWQKASQELWVKKKNTNKR